MPENTLYIANAIYFGYVGIYTPMKRISPLNTPIGALFGALPVLLGASAV